MNERMLSRRSALQGAAVLTASAFANAQTPPAPAPTFGKPRTRDAIWIPTLDGKFCSGMIHRPADMTGKVPAALLFHGLVGSKDQPHRLLVALGDALAAMGHLALRVDLLGRGDSEGESVDATPARDIQNARDALAALQQLPDVDGRDITAIGFSYGGVMASYLAGESTAVKRVVLISSCPVDHATWKPRFETIDGREVVDQSGNMLARGFYDGVYDLTPLSQLKRNRQAVFMVHGTHDETTRPDDYDACKNELSFADVNVKNAKIEAADHSLTRPQAQRLMIEHVTTWLKQQG